MVTLPDSAHGVLKLDGTTIATGDLPQTVTRAELDGGKLVFDPAAGFEGQASFTFKVVDSLGASAVSANTATVRVAKVLVAMASSPAGNAYNVGETIRAALTFPEAVSVDTAGGRPRLKIKMDPNYGEKWAVYESGSGTNTLVFAYRVVLPNESPRGIAVLDNSLDLNGGTIKSLATQGDMPLGMPGIAHDPAHKVDSRVDVCGRTPQVKEALEEAFGRDCGAITQADLSGLSFLDLRDRVIGTLKARDFYGLDNLYSLYLGDNGLTGLPNGVFAGLWRLKNLSLYPNSLATLPANVFACLGQLEDLDARATGLTGIHADAFACLPNLMWLDLAQNRLTALPEGLFDHNPRLRSVTFTWNQIETVPEGVFDGLSDLKGLALCFNELISLPDEVFDDLSGLEWLQLQGNDLENSLDSDVFGSLSRLEELSLGQKEISSPTASLFGGLSGLRELHLDNNELGSLPSGLFGGLSGLRELDLDNNSLSALPNGVFSSLTALEKLVLTNNRGTPFALDDTGLPDGMEVKQ